MGATNERWVMVESENDAKRGFLDSLRVPMFIISNFKLYIENLAAIKRAL